MHLLLKEQGLPFKKDGFTLRWIDETASPKIAKIVNFQRSAFGTKDCISFTINLGVLVEYGKKPISPKLKVWECPIRKRPASWTEKYPCDKWWDVTEATNIEQLYCEMRNLTTESIIPFFERYQNSK
ncbi:MAG: DUF4304 domain-containing protein [Oscillospiraceae bacterium]|nr:DUF4304 domain-containing protein [Oscillospiraceae bacterium]